jgi:NodT family efflux transporter outer membrane factor (OMF) lipoprotein
VNPELVSPDQWHHQLTRGLTTGDASLRTWWQVFNDPILDSLIQRSADGNIDLKVAVSRIEEARARRGVARGAWFPFIDGIGSYARNLIPDNSLPPVPGLDDKFDLYEFGVDSSWEIDVFGRIRRSVESADASLEATVENYRDVLVSLYSEVALNYVRVRSLQERIRYAESNIVSQSKTLELVTIRKEAGLVGDLDVQQADLNLAQTEAFLPILRRLLVDAINRLGVLVGAYPDALHDELGKPGPIPGPPPDIAVGVPAELVRQRPDLRRAERELAAQTARIGVATSDLYPRFSLVGSFTFSGTKFKRVWEGDSFGFGAGPSVRWNVFDGGRIRNNIKAEEAIAEQAFYTYEQTLLRALEEVDGSMTAYVEEGDRRDKLLRAVAAAQKSVELVNELYLIGLTDFQNVKDSERDLFIQQDELAASEGQVTENLVRIYRALGGGWAQ